MMQLFKRANTKPSGGHSTLEWQNETYTRMERMRREYGRNPEFMVYLEHAYGLVHNCAVMNADACSAGVLKLYKRKGATGGVRSGYRGKVVKSAKSIQMKQGKYGRKLAEFTNGGAEMVEVVSHEILDFIANPSPMFPGAELWQLSWYQRWIGGNSYEFVDMAGKPEAMPLYSQFVQMMAPDGGEVEFVYGRSNEEWGRYQKDEVLHSRLRASPHSPLYGMGALQGALPYADLIQDSTLYDISLAKNGMRFDYIVQVPELTDPDEIDKMERVFSSRFKGVANWFKPLFVKGDVKVHNVTIPEKELMSLPKREEASKIIRQAFGHTESMDDSNDSTYVGALVGFNDQYLGKTIEPALQRDAAQKNAGLLRMFGLSPDEYCFAYEPLVVKDEAKVEERVRLNVQSGIMTVNEARTELGLEEVNQENADMLLVNGQPLGAVAAPADPFAGLLGGFSQQPKDEPKAEDEVSAPGSVQVDETDDDEPEEKAFDSGSITKSILELESPMYKPCPSCRSTKDDDDDIAADPTLKEALRRFEGKVEGVAFDIVTDMQREAVTAYGAGREPDLVDLRAQSAGLLKSNMQEIVEFGVLNILESNEGPLGAITVPQEAFDIVPERALAFLENYTIELADDLAKTTADMSRRAVEVGLENGLSIDKIAQEIEGVPAHRAKLIARMETSRAVQHGKREGMIAVGTEEHKVITAPGARPEHVEIASQGAIPIDQPFVKAGQTIGDETYPRDMYAPPFWFGCRCAVVPVFD